MSVHSYTAQQALEVLMRKLRQRDETLASRVQTAIDVGKDASETLPASNMARDRVYRKTVPLTHEEALQVALNALQAFFVEQPLFAEDAADNFAKAALGVPSVGRLFPGTVGDIREPVTPDHVGDEKQIEVELQTETQITRTGEETLSLKRTPRSQIEEQQRNIAQLRTLIDFTEG